MKQEKFVHTNSKLIAKLKQLPASEITEVIKESLDPFGRYHFAIALLLAFNNGLIAIPDTISSLYAYTPKKFNCLKAGINDTCTVGCTNYEFYDADTSIVTEWDLICEQKYLMALTTTIYYTGVALGSIICGVLGDLWGRKTTMLMCLYLQGFYGAIVYFSKTFNWFIVIRFVQGFFVMGVRTNTYALLQELTPPHKSTLTSAIWASAWGVGTMFLGLTGYFIRDWRTLQLVVAIPTFCTLTYSWIFPESPNWYLTKNDKISALTTALKLADKNDVTILYKPKGAKEDENIKTGTIKDLFTNKILLKHLIGLTLIWFSTVISYYGILFYMPELPGGRHLNFMVSGLIESIAPFVGLNFFASPRFGRKYSMIAFQYCTTLLCVLVGLLTMISEEDSWKIYLAIPSAIIAKLFAFFCFNGAVIYGVELFPTVVRSSASGVCGIFSRIGTLVAPQILLLGDYTHSTVPMLVIAFCTFIGGSVVFVLPETLNEPLPNTMDDVEENWGKRKDNQIPL